jgi:ADP-ribose pyrophosphatase YjhB (NUDIX family)
MKKVILFVLATLILGACQESLEDKCARECVEFTKRKCPSAIAQDMIVDSMTFDRASHTVQYYYKLTGASDRPDAYPKDQAKDLLKNALKNTTQVMSYKEAGYNFRYIYYSEKNPQTIFLDILLTEKDYQ